MPSRVLDRPRPGLWPALVCHICALGWPAPAAAGSVPAALPADPPAMSATPIPVAELSIERLVSSAFKPESAPAIRWLTRPGEETTVAYTTIEPVAATAGQIQPASEQEDARPSQEEEAPPKDIVRYDLHTGARTVLVSAAQLTPPGTDRPLAIDGYEWSGDRKRLLLYTNARKVWRRKTRGDYWTLDLDSQHLRRLGPPASGEDGGARLMFASFSPDGTRVAYLRRDLGATRTPTNLYVEDLATGAITALTRDAEIRRPGGGGRTVINGTADWVNEEEFGIRKAYEWSPDGRYIAYWQFDATAVRDFYLINNTDTLYPAVTPVPYPKAGTANAAVRIGIVAAGGGPTRWLSLSDDPSNHYVARIAWSPDSRELFLQHLDRPQQTLDLLAADAATGKIRHVLRERADTWVDMVEDFDWLDDAGREFLWVSERGGWRHAYRASRNGGAPQPIVRGDFDAIRLAGKDASEGWLYFIASPDDATQRRLYRVRLDGSSRVPERLTPAHAPGAHGYDLSPDGRWAVHTVSRLDAPPQVALLSLPDHRVRHVFTDNTALRAKLDALFARPAEFFRITIPDLQPAATGKRAAVTVQLDGWMLKPPRFDPAKRYPVLVYVYGEPAGQTTVDRWLGERGLFHRYLAAQGYIVASLDNRGTPAPKGRAWRHAVYGAVGVLAADEQAAAVRALLAERPYLDPDRVGVWGWSGGGSMTLHAMFRYPELYRMGMSLAPVPDQRYYDTIYQERYMHTPQANPDGYRRGSPITYAEGLRGKLLLVSGTGDDNVHYQITELLMNRLVALGKPFDLMIYPNRSHSINEGEGTTPHLYGTMARYITAHLPANGRE